MTNARARRIDNEYCKRLFARFLLFRDALREYQAARLPRSAEGDWHPFFSDYLLMPQIREVTEAPAGTAVTKEMLLAICEDQIPAMNAKWYDDRKQDFVALIRKMEPIPELEGELPEDPDVLLSLAIATFHCGQCQSYGMRFPQVLAHRCGRTVTFYGSTAVRDGREQKYRHTMGRTCLEHRLMHPWSEGTLTAFSFNPDLKQACAVISACGKDPTKATLEEMEACRTRLLFRACHADRFSGSSPTLAYDWKRAVSLRMLCSSCKLISITLHNRHGDMHRRITRRRTWPVTSRTGWP